MTREAKILKPYATDILDVRLQSTTVRSITINDMDWNSCEMHECDLGVEAPEGFEFRLHVRLERKK